MLLVPLAFGSREAPAQVAAERDSATAAERDSATVAEHASATDLILAADDRRIEAMTRVDAAALDAILDDDLHYAHSSGTVDTKDSFIDLVTSGRTKYLEYEPQPRRVTFPLPGVAIMTGRTDVVVENEKGRNAFTLSYLAVWREVRGEWLFFAWQSARLPPAQP